MCYMLLCCYVFMMLYSYVVMSYVVTMLCVNAFVPAQDCAPECVNATIHQCGIAIHESINESINVQTKACAVTPAI